MFTARFCLNTRPPPPHYTVFYGTLDTFFDIEIRVKFQKRNQTPRKHGVFDFVFGLQLGLWQIQLLVKTKKTKKSRRRWRRKRPRRKEKQNCDDDDNDDVVRCNQCRNLPRAGLITKNETKCLLFTWWLVSFLVFNPILDIKKSASATEVKRVLITPSLIRAKIGVPGNLPQMPSFPPRNS